MDIYKQALKTLKQDARRNYTCLDVITTMSNSYEGRSEINMLRKQKVDGKSRNEREIMMTFANTYRYAVATAMGQLNLKGYVSKEGQTYKITELGLQKLKELEEKY